MDSEPLRKTDDSPARARAEMRLTEEYDAAQERGGIKRNGGSLAISPVTSARAENLTWTHHREVASLPPDQRVEALNAAARGGLSTRADGTASAIRLQMLPSCVADSRVRKSPGRSVEKLLRRVIVVIVSTGPHSAQCG